MYMHTTHPFTKMTGYGKACKYTWHGTTGSQLLWYISCHPQSAIQRPIYSAHMKSLVSEIMYSGHVLVYFYSALVILCLYNYKYKYKRGVFGEGERRFNIYLADHNSISLS